MNMFSLKGRQIRLVVFVALSIMCVQLHKPALAEMSEDQFLAEFVKGNFAYKDGRYKDALEIYLKIVDNGRESGPLYYNMGNCYMKLGQLGKAILSYERARLLMPRDGDLKANYRYALSLMKGGWIEPNYPLFKRIFFNFMGNLTLQELAVLLFLIGVAMMGFHLLSLFLAWQRRIVQGGLFVLTVLFSVLFVSLILKTQKAQALSIITETVESKFEPKDEATTHFKLYEGNKVQILKDEGLWVKVRRLDGKIGWAPKKSVEKI